MIDDAIDKLSYPSLNPSFVPVLIDENTIHLRAGAWGGPIKTIRDPEESSDLKQLFNALDGRTHITELFNEFDREDQTDVAELLLQLYQDSIIYNNQSRSTAWSHAVINPDLRGKDSTSIREKSILVISLGSIGHQIAEDLVLEGLENVVLANPYPEKQTLVDSDDRSELSEIVLTGDSIESAVREASFVVACSDRPHRDLFHQVNEIAIESETPWTAGQLLGRNGIVGPTVFPGETACYACFERRLLSNVQSVKECEKYLATGENRERSTNSPLGRVVAGYLSMDLFNLLAFGSGYTAGRVFTIDARTLSFSADDVLRIPRCSVCANDKTAGETTFLTIEDLVKISDNADGDEL